MTIPFNFIPRFKTEICRNFKERNKCVYGDRCQFAHGRRLVKLYEFCHKYVILR